MTSDGDRRTVRGYTLWREDLAGKPVELNTATAIEVDGQQCRWVVSSPSMPEDEGLLVESASREVQRFVNGVFTAMHRIARRSTVRPVPKPSPKPTRRVPANAPVPCPLCQGDAWVDCEVCDGAGVVTQQRSAEWEKKNR